MAYTGSVTCITRREGNHMSRPSTAAALLVILLPGCIVAGASGPRPIQSAALDVSSATAGPGQRQALISRSVAALQGRGYILALLDHGEGVITTRPRLVNAVPCGPWESATCQASDVVQVTVSAASRVTVTLSRELDDGRGRSPASTEVEGKAVEAEQYAILAGISGRPLQELVPPVPAPPSPDGLSCPAWSGLIQAWLRVEATLVSEPGPSGSALRVLVKGTPVCATDWHQAGAQQVRLEANVSGWVPEAALGYAAPSLRPRKP